MEKSDETFSLRKAPNVHSFFQPLSSTHKFSTCMTTGTELDTSFQVCPSWRRARVLQSVPDMPVDFLQQIVSEASAKAMDPLPMCDGRPFASSLFRRVASRGAFCLCGAPVLSSLQVAIHLCKRQIPNVHERHCRETNQIQCNSPYNTASCYVLSAVWLGRRQTFLTQIEHAK